MSRALATVFPRCVFVSAAVWGLVLSGCQCCGITERAADIVDTIADSEIALDPLYCSKLDLTRINRPGGIECGCYCPQPASLGARVYALRWADPTDLSPAAESRGEENEAPEQSPPAMESPLPAPEMQPEDVLPLAPGEGEQAASGGTYPLPEWEARLNRLMNADDSNATGGGAGGRGGPTLPAVPGAAVDVRGGEFR